MAVTMLGPARGGDVDRPKSAEPVMPGTGPAREFETFYTAHVHELARLAYLVVGDRTAADDIAADALLAVWKQWDRVMVSDHPTAYVRRMVINIATSSVRGRIRERRGLRALLSGVEPTVAAADGATVVDVRAALQYLSPGRRACVILRYAFDLSVEDVAATLQISTGTVKSQTSKGVAQLRAVIGPGDVVDGPPFVPEQGRP